MKFKVYILCLKPLHQIVQKKYLCFVSNVRAIPIIVMFKENRNILFWYLSIANYFIRVNTFMVLKNAQ